MRSGVVVTFWLALPLLCMDGIPKQAVGVGVVFVITPYVRERDLGHLNNSVQTWDL